MKSKKTPLRQFAFETKYLEDNEDFLEHLSSHIGRVVIEFNMLEERLTALICQFFINDIDAIGLIVTENMNYAAKIDLFDRYVKYIRKISSKEIAMHEKLVRELKESGRLRNLVVHADWSHSDLDGFTFVKMRMKNGKMDQEFVQLDEDSLIHVRNTIIETYNAFDDYEDEFFRMRNSVD